MPFFLPAPFLFRAARAAPGGAEKVNGENEKEEEEEEEAKDKAYSSGKRWKGKRGRGNINFCFLLSSAF